MTGNNHEGNERSVRIVSGKEALEGNLSIPSDAKGIVLFAHGSGSSRFSPRNRFVASILNRAGIATLLMDLLTEEEEEIDARTGEFRFNIDLLAQRLVDATRWVKKNGSLGTYEIGYFGGSTGAAAALIAAAKLPRDVVAVVSRGGRPDLAIGFLGDVRAPVLLVVGGFDEAVVEMNREAMRHLGSAETKLEIVPGASHLFEEAGKLEIVAELASRWFLRHFEKLTSKARKS